MASKPRSQKTPTELWVTDGYARLRADRQMSSKAVVAMVAELCDVSEATANGWQSRGRPNEDAIRILEGLFGTKAPDGERAVAGDAALAAALSRQADALADLAKALVLIRTDRAKLDQLEALVGSLVERLQDGPAPGVPGEPGAPRGVVG